MNSSLPVADEPKPAVPKGRPLFRTNRPRHRNHGRRLPCRWVGLSLFGIWLWFTGSRRISSCPEASTPSKGGRCTCTVPARDRPPSSSKPESAALRSAGIWFRNGFHRLTRVCTYDRSGLGWSEPRDGPQDSETIARRLHILLNEAGVPRPLLLVGHSGGGLYIREYTRQFHARGCRAGICRLQFAATDWTNFPAFVPATRTICATRRVTAGSIACGSGPDGIV